MSKNNYPQVSQTDIRTFAMLLDNISNSGGSSSTWAKKSKCTVACEVEDPDGEEVILIGQHDETKGWLIMTRFKEDER